MKFFFFSSEGTGAIIGVYRAKLFLDWMSIYREIFSCREWNPNLVD